MRRINVKPIALCLALVIFASSFCSCGMFDEVSSLIGLDTYDYMAESITESLSSDSDEWTKILDMLPILTVNSTELPEFDTSSESHKLCADSLLNYMLNKSFAKYAGNSELIEAVTEKYPNESFLAVIPKDDFETTMYMYFGGSSKISNGSTELFRYLDDAEVYVPAVGPIASGVEFDIISIDETEHSYRVVFNATAGEYTFKYFALIIKRDDGSLYYKTVIKE